jgi:phage terminase large subunit GpA-like protein
MNAPAIMNRWPDGRPLFLNAFAGAVRPRQRLSVSQWADSHRQLTSKASSESGQWKTSRTPYLREPMDCLSVRSVVQKVVLMFPTQIGKTEVALNWMGYVMDHAPAPMLVVVPTLEVRKRWVRQRLDPMLTETKTLAKLFDAKRRRDAANAEDMKDFPGGFLVIGGANSPASLASMPIKYVIDDEIDRFPWEVGKEGDPLGLIRERQKTFPRRKELLLSTPTMTGASRIEEEFNASDKRYYNVPCPHCDELLVLRWKQLQWNSTVTEARYVCEFCGAEIQEHHKATMLPAGRWVPTVPELSDYARGYWLNALYAPLGLGFRWVELARDWKAAQDDKAKLKRFINTSLAETYQDRSREVQSAQLKNRSEPYALREIPPGCLILTCGIDVQGDRLALQVVGWGRDEACWIIDWFELPGDPVRMLDEARRAEGALVEYLKRPFQNKFGKELSIQAIAIDTGGHNTHDVYNFVRSGVVRRLMAIKGSSKPGRPILASRPAPQDVNWRGKVIKGGVKLWTVGTDTAKSALTARLIGDNNLLEQAADDAEKLGGAVVLKVHFSEELGEDYYEQLTSEVFDPERNRWVRKRGRRNEGLDTWVYAAAAAQHPEIRVHAMRKADWDRIEKLLEPPAPQTPDTPPPAASPDDQANNHSTKRPAVRNPNRFLNRWK